MQCSRCQAVNPSGAKFCGACGAVLVSVCPACQTGNPSANRFCHACGQPLGGSALPTSGRTGFEDERKQVTILFADLKGSMELLADRDPEDARRLLDPVLELMIEAVRRYEGTVNQVMGDGIMALFGAPYAQEDHAVRACYAALLMQDSVETYGEKVLATDSVTIRIRIGLNSGEVVVRSIGSDLQIDYTAVGQATHLAARMEQLATPGSILLTESVVRLAQGAVEIRDRGPTSVKGLGTPVKVYELVRAAAGVEESWAGRHTTPFVGRATEMALLHEISVRAQAGRGQMMAVTGDAGVGKSRLCAEFVRASCGEGWLILQGRALSYGQTTAYLPIVELLRKYFEIETGQSADHVRDTVAPLVQARHPGLVDSVAPLLALLEALPADDPFRSLDPQRRRTRIMEALEGLLLLESARRPVLVLIEDLQWIDTETRAFLERLVERLSSARLILLVTHRREHQHGWFSQTHYTELGIEALSADEADELVTGLVGSHPSLEPLRQHLVKWTSGNPFFLEESVRTLVETQALVGEPGAYRLERPAEAMKVPATVQALLAARIDRLPSREKFILQAASVVGTDVPLRLLEGCVEVSEDLLQTSLRHLQSTGFLHETGLLPESQYTFTHLLTHEVAYASLLKARRQALHARLVGLLEGSYPERIVMHVERLAFHASRGEVWGKATHYHRQAGLKAVERSANQEAVGHLRDALEALARLPESRETLEQAIDLRLELRPPLLQLGCLDEALAVSREAESVAQRLGDEHILARVYTYLVNYHHMKGEPARALEYGERCLATGEKCQDLLLTALARQYIGQSCHVQGRYQEAVAALDANVRGLQVEHDQGVFGAGAVSYVVSSGWLALTLAELGKFEVAGDYLERARRTAEARRHPYSQAIAWTLTGFVRLLRGLPESAIPPLVRSVEACGERSLIVWQPIPMSLLGLAFARIGRVGEGLPWLERAVTRSEELGVKAYLARWVLHLAEGLLDADRAEQAAQAAARARELAAIHGERGQEVWVFYLLGRIASCGGRPHLDEASKHYRAAIALAGELGMRPALAWSHDGLARVHDQLRDQAKAKEHREASAALVKEMALRSWPSDDIEELQKRRQLFIVARQCPDLYASLAREFSETPNVKVVLDRRQGERRRQDGQKHPDTRRGERRRGAEAEQLTAWGVAVLSSRPTRPG